MKYDETTRNIMNNYLRQWRKANPDKCREYRARYWKRRAEKAQQQPAGQSDSKGGEQNA